ncbi:unnamed protein product, partial [Scytosiphon promiscuus]
GQASTPICTTVLRCFLVRRSCGRKWATWRGCPPALSFTAVSDRCCTHDACQSRFRSSFGPLSCVGKLVTKEDCFWRWRVQNVWARVTRCVCNLRRLWHRENVKCRKGSTEERRQVLYCETLPRSS